ncbi:MAG: hypothetical protein PHH37_01130 [Paludibacter sp.]|nr:hypothetical protein [Paludibacter sp.]
MKTFFSIIFISVLIILSSCGQHSSEYKSLKAQNDSLMQAKHKMQEELDGYFSTMNQIEQNIEKIKDTQGIITTENANEELDSDARAKINDDLNYLNEMLKANKEELANLKEKIRKSTFKSNELERTIERLTKALETESEKVALLETQIAQKDSIIVQLDNTVESMNEDIQELKTDVTDKQKKISEQDEAIHTAWYVFGTRKELKEQNIITSGGLFGGSKVLQSDFNKNYFVRIDARKTKSIPLYSTRAKILTTHPKSSYTLEKENGNYVLLIVDTKEFWSVSKYLVIEVD